MKNTKAKLLVESAVMVAFAFVLSLLKIWEMPFGGSVTMLSMLPIILIAVKNGVKWGLGAAFCYSLTQLAVSGVFAWGLTPTILVGSIMLDYVVAFTVLGVAGVFGKSRKSAIAGTVFACAVRFISHFLSGFILWANLEKFVAFGNTWVNRPVLYSLCYNGAFMLPEIVFTTVGVAVIVNIPAMRKLLNLTK